MTGSDKSGHVTVTVEAVAFVAAALNWGADRSRAVHTITVPEGTTVEGLMRRFADRTAPFDALVFSSVIQVIVGDQLLELAGGWNRVLSDGDTLLLLPAFSGG